jgi:hypothetical protein
MSFSRPRVALGGTELSSVFELLRFCVKTDYKSVGIFGKILSRFIRDINPKKIISYADPRFTDKNNNIYLKNGFSLKSISDPGYWYIKGYKRIHRFQFQKSKLIKEGFDPLLTEREIMTQRKYNILWDCGQFRFEKIITPKNPLPIPTQLIQ